MKRIAALLLLVALGCASAPGTHHIFKSSGGPTYGTVDFLPTAPTVSDPGIVRLANTAGGLQVSTNGGAFAAIGGGTVTTDATLTGNGTGGSPLGVNPVAARAPDWFIAMKVAFQQWTGLSPLAFSCVYENDFGATTFPVAGATSQGFQSSGTGAGPNYTNLPGGVVQCTGPTSGAGWCDWSPSGAGTGWTTLNNLQTKRWMIADRITIGKAPSAASRVSFGAVSSVYVGLGFGGADATWHYERGNPPADVADTGKTITVDATGATGYLTMAVGNFDVAHIGYNADVLGSSFAQPTNAEAASNLPSAQANAYFFNEGTGAGDVYFLDKVMVCTEL